MHVLALNQFYAPDHSATAQLLTELCEDLVASGDQVTVIASQGSYLGGERWAAREERGGVQVVRPPSTSLGKASLPRRLADYLSFWVSSIAAALREQKPNVVLALTTPPLIATAAVLAASVRRVPVVSWVQDVYPDLAHSFGVLPQGSLTYRLLRELTLLTHRRSARIVALSSGMKERLIAQGAPSERITIIPNWSDGRHISLHPPGESAFRHEHALGGRFVAMYSGNMGLGHEFQTFLDAASLLRERCPEALLLFVGDGARRREALAASAGLPNVRFLPYQPRERLPESLAAADVHLISLREDLEGLLVPSKLYGALASGRPVCYVGPERCEVARVLSAHDCGSVRRPGDAQGVASVLTTWWQKPEQRRQLGQRARLAFESFYDRPVTSQAFRELLSSAARDGF